MGKVRITIDADKILLALGTAATGVAIFAGTVIWREPISSFFGSLFGGEIKNACLEWKNDITIINNSNPLLSSNYEDIANHQKFEEWKVKGDNINKKLFNALGIEYRGIEQRNIYKATLEQLNQNIKLNVEGMMKAVEKCKNAGVDFNAPNY